VARNRKRAKDRRARRPQPVGSARPELDEGTPSAIRHAAPDAELAEAQMALGRPELAGEAQPEDDEELEYEALGGEAGGSGRVGDAGDSGDEGGSGGDGGSGGGASSGGLAVPGGAAPSRRSVPGNRLINFLLGSWRELQRVQWPDRRQVMQATGVVIGFVIVAGLFLGAADAVATQVMQWILGT
jgi:preprotein translocase subunit SecE